MSAQPVLPVIAPLSAYLQLAPIVPNIAQPPVFVPRSQPWCNLATADAQAPVTYPPPEIRRAGASYHQEPIPELLKKENNEWAFCLPISAPPDLINPTLTSLAYYIKYATTHDNRDSTVQTDIILTNKSCPSGIILDPTDLVVYRDAAGHAPRVIDEESAVRLLSVTSRKGNGGIVQSSHHTDHHYITPNLRVVETSNLYLTFHVFEYATVETLRSLAVEISATWLDDALERKRREYERWEEKKKKAAEKRKKKEEEERKRAEEAKKQAEAAARAELLINGAPGQADSNIQQTIEDTVKKLNIEPCPKGYVWSKEANGYRCKGGQHFVSFEQIAQGATPEWWKCTYEQ